MSFLVTAALALSVLVALPAIAHLFRRGRARALPFPPAGLVPAARTLARRERRLEDKLLLLVRALAVLVLAVIGATPFVQCSRLSLARGSGASLAVAVVIDDSLSMRAKLPDGATRWKRAHDAALDLLASAREGDAVAVVLAGKPARIALGMTSDLALARRVVADLHPSDRATDLGGAVRLARATLSGGAERPRRIVLLSDHAGEPPPAGTPPVWSPLPALARAVPDCGIVSAERRGSRVTASIACNRADAARERRLEVTAAEGSGVEPSKEARPQAVDARPSGGKSLGAVALEPRAGVQTVTLSVQSKERLLAVRLTGDDAIGHDDAAPVSPDDAVLQVAVVADATRSGVATGGATPLEQAIAALQSELALRPLPVLPDQASELEPFGLVVLDDPGGLGPESRAALMAYVERGGLALALLGPRVEGLEIGSTLEPFAIGALHWQNKPDARGARVASLGWLGPEAASLDDLSPEGRVALDAGRLREARIVAEFSDGAPFIIERALGRGSVITITLPSSPSESDFALRPGFVALLDHYLGEAEQRRGSRRTLAGATWAFGSARPTIEGPEGPLELRDAANAGRVASPPVRGLYRVVEAGREELRTATVEPDEITLEPQPPPPSAAENLAEKSERGVDVSNEFGLILALLLALELGLRVVRSLAGKSLPWRRSSVVKSAGVP